MYCLQVKSKFIQCLADGVEQARLERWTSVDYARQSWAQAGKKGAKKTTGPEVLGVNRGEPARNGFFVLK